MYKNSLFLFRRDIRIHDNTALIAASQNSQSLHVAFIFDPRQRNHDYFSPNAFEFFKNSLTELQEETQSLGGHLNILSGLPHEVLELIFKKNCIDALYINADYTPFAKDRDQHIEDLCRKYNVAFHSFHDALLTPPGSVLKDDKTPYTIFTPFYTKAKHLPIRPVNEHIPHNITANPPAQSIPIKDTGPNPYAPHMRLLGGRKEALEILQNLPHNYEMRRDLPFEKGTTLLSAHHKFGTISIRESYQALCQTYGKDHLIISELFWRDFFTHIAYHFLHVFGHSFKSQYDDISWDNNLEKFEAWKQELTGYPIVDAGMRELINTGYMHNRVRMITASFLVKDLHIDWRWGEKYFAQQLIDYDPSVNNGNWQWAASTGCDAQPYFRIFNPKRQQERFDPQCQYIQKWIPELQGYSPKDIHNFENFSFQKHPQTLVNHARETAQTKALFQEAKKYRKYI